MSTRSISDSDSVVHTAWKRAVCAFALLAGIWFLAGCAGRTSSVEGEGKRDINGYYEVHREGTLYVLGSMTSVNKLEAGKPPANAIPSHSRTGEPISFEDDGSGLSYRLMAEYDRRHGIR